MPLEFEHVDVLEEYTQLWVRQYFVIESVNNLLKTDAVCSGKFFVTPCNATPSLSAGGWSVLRSKGGGAVWGLTAAISHSLWHGSSRSSMRCVCSQSNLHTQPTTSLLVCIVAIPGCRRTTVLSSAAGAVTHIADM